MEEHSTTSTRLSGNRLLIARLVWVSLVLLMVGLWAIGLVSLIREPLPDCSLVPCDPMDLNAGDLEVVRELNLPTGFLGGAFTFVASILSGLVYFIIGGIIFWRKSDDWIGLLVSFTLVFLGALFFTSSNDALLRAYPGVEPLIQILMPAGLLCLFALFFVFPDGQFVPPRLTWPVFGMISTLLFLSFLRDSGEVTELLFALLYLGVGTLSVASQIYRYFRISTPTEQQQTKWVLLGLFGSLALATTWISLAWLFPADQPSASRVYALLVAVPLIFFFMLLLPVSLAFSILRYRLWDIEVIANRTLVYGLVTGVLVLIYIGSIILLQGIFRVLTGQDSPLAVVFSTLFIAALFAPIRGRIQSVIDRRFFRRKYDAQQVLIEFAVIARDEVSLDKLTAELQRVTEETMQPTQVSLWINPKD